MIVLIDTNVLVSAVLKDRDPEAIILFVAERDDIEWLVSPQIMAEYREVLSRPKFGLPDEIRQSWFDLLDALTVSVEVDLEIDFPRDRKDAKFLACALTIEADYLYYGRPGFQRGPPTPLHHHPLRCPVQKTCMRKAPGKLIVPARTALSSAMPRRMAPGCAAGERLGAVRSGLPLRPRGGSGLSG